MNRWGLKGPPPEAYSRASDPERFRSLHSVALRLLEVLQGAFNVERMEGYGVDRELEVGDLARPSVRLVPGDPKAAPLAIVFTAFPGLKVRAGRWWTLAFPTCGCDACDELSDDEAKRLEQLVDDVTAGRFREGISLPLSGGGVHTSELWSPRHRHTSRSQVDVASAREMLSGSDPMSIDWGPWPRHAATDP